MSERDEIRDTGEMRDKRDAGDTRRDERRTAMADERDTRDTGRDERWASDRRDRETTRESMRSNPEVMERESMRDSSGRAGGPGEHRTVDGGGSDMWPDMGQFHHRFDRLQSDFIEDPRDAVKKAGKLMEEMLDHLSRSMRERTQTMNKQVDKSDTEQLRVTMQRHKEFLRSFGRR
jgi:hypothetical protein